MRYDAPASLCPPTPLTPCSSSHLTLLTSKSRGPPLRYRILVPPNPIGPLDIVSAQLIVEPLDSSVSIRSASAFVERRIYFNDFRVSLPESPPGAFRSSSHPPTNLQSASDQAQHTSSSTYPESSDSSLQDLLHPASSSSVYSGDSSRPLLQHHENGTDLSVPLPTGGRGTTHIFAHAESAGRFSRDSSGMWRHKLTFSWPDTKSNSRWSVGESVQTALTSVKFFLRVKVRVIVPFNTTHSKPSLVDCLFASKFRGDCRTRRQGTYHSIHKRITKAACIFPIQRLSEHGFGTLEIEVPSWSQAGPPHRTTPIAPSQSSPAPCFRCAGHCICPHETTLSPCTRSQDFDCFVTLSRRKQQHV